MLSTSAFLALVIQCASSIHPDTAQDIARVESGFNPYAIGVVGNKGIFPKSLEEAQRHVKRLQSEGKRYSVGLMQITSTNFEKYQTTAEKLFSPCENLMVFEKVITDCYQRGGNLKRALSCYYSGNFTTGQKTEKDFSSSYVNRIGYNGTSDKYIVPSTKEEKRLENNTSLVEQEINSLPIFESWDVLREYPRQTTPKGKQTMEQTDNTEDNSNA